METPTQPATPPPMSPANNSYFQNEQVKADLGRRTVRGGAITVFYQVLKQVISLGATIILSRLLRPEDSGLINMVLIVTGFVSLFSDLGLSSATIQRDQIDQAKISTLFWINVVMGMGLSLVAAALSPGVAWFYNEPRLLLVMLAISTGFFFGGLSVQHRALLKRQLRIGALVYIDLAATLVGIAVAIVSAFLLPTDQLYWALVFENMVQPPVEIIGLWIVCRWRPSRPAMAEGVRSMIMFGGNVTGFQLVNYFARNLDNLLIGKFFGAAPVGLYNKAYGLLLLPLRRINEPVAAVAVPALSRLTDEPERYRQAYQRIVAKVCMITMPLVAFMMLASEWLVPFLLGNQWREASKIFTLLGISGLVEPFSYTTGWLFVTQGRGREQLRWGIISTSLTVAGIVIGLPWGPEGVAMGYGLVGLFIRTPLLFWFVGRTGPVRTHHLYKGILPFALTSVAVMLSLYGLRFLLPSGIDLTEWQLFINLVVATLLTAVVSLIVLALQPSGREALKDLRSIPTLLLKRK